MYNVYISLLSMTVVSNCLSSYLQDGLMVPGISQRLIHSVRVFSFEIHGHFHLSLELGN